MELRPSEAVVCMCTSPRMSLDSMRRGRACLGGGLDLAKIFAHFGRHPVHLEGGVNLFFGCGGDGGLVVEAGESPFAQCVTHFQGALAERNVVGLGAGKVLERRTVALGGQQADVNLEASGDVEADLVFALGNYVVNAGIGGDVLDGGFSVLRGAGRTGDEQVEVAGGFAATAQGTGGSDALDAGEGQQIGGEAFGGVLGLVDAKAAGGAAIVLDAFADLFDLLCRPCGAGP